LFNVIEQIKSNSPEHRMINTFHSIEFSNGAGMDVLGNRIYSIFTEEIDEVEKYAVAFLLRDNSLDDDLIFWNEVVIQLLKLNNVTTRLTAYCENEKCNDIIRKKQDAVNFTVLEYGVVGDMQAVFSPTLTTHISK